jgi:hypothetical protein
MRVVYNRFQGVLATYQEGGNAGLVAGGGSGQEGETTATGRDDQLCHHVTDAPKISPSRAFCHFPLPYMLWSTMLALDLINQVLKSNVIVLLLVARWFILALGIDT